ncbi:2-succinyl-6-hydroxy-2, 4-cyclohexadiene-1-carboxylate synthase [Arsenophonus endosymbiont of Aleurodicus floccissimus]|uniref:2-succinyl-6-hydroxy-2, 4-cyclohexadiene-1-carboxylate synthase n=1 Tax=Arsenophonus endosymbiont of Aleurodicus floccissimus TaxID=2152761 RepID=UPI000EBF32E5|nr:2-succinyl-6-hydroxy-2,4-cyclohexadiene-1-carboxylate synthase [Arsenophonus endosymbiont of Aleurodicus floccissimus]SPP31451.1 2-succinyl-6-hydroxy-2, 4-cyclohexadiene-1-carboxylate synthase [Arsenophonus endosymbiont of Aleurodicus floccissimus]
MPYTRRYHETCAGTWLVWLHGLLGNGNEWLPIIEKCVNRLSLTIDLPGHGCSPHIQLTDFSHVSRLIEQAIGANQIDSYYLIGYSFGGRIAMYYGCQFQPTKLKGLIVEGANVGLTQPTDRLLRVKHDQSWAKRFRCEPMDSVLSDWYQQAVFDDLSAEQRQQLITERGNNSGEYVAHLLETTSLGKQPCLVNKLLQRNYPFSYLCGEYDEKFCSISQ